jgi:hypothetical protein
MKPEPHKLHLDAMRRAIADVRLAAGEIDTRAWLATVPHRAPPPAKPRDATAELLREIRKAVLRG